MTDALPPTGRPNAEVLRDLQAFGADDPDYRHGRLWSLVYWLDEAHDEFLASAWRMYSSANGLNPGAFKSLKRMESEIVASVATLQHGDDATCGVLTSGGTESCLLATKTYRDLARATRGVKRPRMILPVTAHVAWFKAAEYFDVEPVLLPLDERLRTDISKLEMLIDRETVMILGSAPGYPHGAIDPIEAMGEIARRKGVPMHVDACVGGMILPFMAMNGVPLPPWDYRVPGVTSISADLHKYGYAAKGASTITYRRLDLLAHQVFVKEDWPGGVFASPALLGTRAGGAYAAAWATLQHLGVDGYRDLARATHEAFTRLRDGVARIPGLAVLGEPSGPLLAYGSRDPAIAIFAVGDRLDARGWSVNRVQHPEGLHAMVTAQHLEVVDRYLADLAAAVAEVRADPSLARQGSAATYGMMAHLPLRGMVRQQVREMFVRQYGRGAAPLDVHAGAAPSRGWRGWAERLALRYVDWKRRRAARGRAGGADSRDAPG
jgi:glutamate/tyrosine decarboxylase-like PLP-dependent enzyme